MGVTTLIKDYGTEILNSIRENDLPRLKQIVEKSLKANGKLQKLFLSDIKHKPTKKFACPLILAARQEDPKIIRYMMEKGTDPNFVHHTIFSSKRKETVTALHIAVDLGHYDTVQILLDANADSNIGDHNYETPLHIATKKADKVLVRMLLSKGADPSIVDRKGNAALHIATLYGHLQMVRSLLKYDADVYQKGQWGAIPPHIAAKEGHIHLIQLFCSRDVGNINIKIPCYPDKREKAPLHLAAENGHVETALVLLDQFEARVNDKDSDGNTPLHCVVLNQYNPGRMRDKDYFNETVRVLLKYRAHINEKNIYGDTPLHLAAMNQFQRIVEILLACGANPLDENLEHLKPIDVVPDFDPVTKQILKNAMLQHPKPVLSASLASFRNELDMTPAQSQLSLYKPRKYSESSILDNNNMHHDHRGRHAMKPSKSNLSMVSSTISQSMDSVFDSPQRGKQRSASQGRDTRQRPDHRERNNNVQKGHQQHPTQQHQQRHQQYRQEGNNENYDDYAEEEYDEDFNEDHQDPLYATPDDPSGGRQQRPHQQSRRPDPRDKNTKAQGPRSQGQPRGMPPKRPQNVNTYDDEPEHEDEVYQDDYEEPEDPSYARVNKQFKHMKANEVRHNENVKGPRREVKQPEYDDISLVSSRYGPTESVNTGNPDQSTMTRELKRIIHQQRQNMAGYEDETFSELGSVSGEYDKPYRPLELKKERPRPSPRSSTRSTQSQRPRPAERSITPSSTGSRGTPVIMEQPSRPAVHTQDNQRQRPAHGNPETIQVNHVPGKPGTIEVSYGGGPISISVDPNSGQYHIEQQHGTEKEIGTYHQNQQYEDSPYEDAYQYGEDENTYGGGISNEYSNFSDSGEYESQEPSSAYSPDRKVVQSAIKQKVFEVMGHRTLESAQSSYADSPSQHSEHTKAKPVAQKRSKTPVKEQSNESLSLLKDTGPFDPSPQQALQYSVASEYEQPEEEAPSPDMTPNVSPQYKSFNQKMALFQTSQTPDSTAGAGNVKWGKNKVAANSDMVLTPESSSWKIESSGSAVVEHVENDQMTHTVQTRHVQYAPQHSSGQDATLSDEEDIEQSSVLIKASQHPHQSHDEYYSLAGGFDLSSASNATPSQTPDRQYPGAVQPMSENKKSQKIVASQEYSSAVTESYKEQNSMDPRTEYRSTSNVQYIDEEMVNQDISNAPDMQMADTSISEKSFKKNIKLSEPTSESYGTSTADNGTHLSGYVGTKDTSRQMSADNIEILNVQRDQVNTSQNSSDFDEFEEAKAYSEDAPINTVPNIVRHPKPRLFDSESRANRHSIESEVQEIPMEFRIEEPRKKKPPRPKVVHPVSAEATVQTAKSCPVAQEVSNNFGQSSKSNVPASSTSNKISKSQLPVHVLDTLEEQSESDISECYDMQRDKRENNVMKIVVAKVVSAVDDEQLHTIEENVHDEQRSPLVADYDKFGVDIANRSSGIEIEQYNSEPGARKYAGERNTSDNIVEEYDREPGVKHFPTSVPPSDHSNINEGSKQSGMETYKEEPGASRSGRRAPAEDQGLTQQNQWDPSGREKPASDAQHNTQTYSRDIDMEMYDNEPGARRPMQRKNEVYDTRRDGTNLDTHADEPAYSRQQKTHTETEIDVNTYEDGSAHPTVIIQRSDQGETNLDMEMYEDEPGSKRGRQVRHVEEDSEQVKKDGAISSEDEEVANIIAEAAVRKKKKVPTATLR